MSAVCLHFGKNVNSFWFTFFKDNRSLFTFLEKNVSCLFTIYKLDMDVPSFMYGGCRGRRHIRGRGDGMNTRRGIFSLSHFFVFIFYFRCSHRDVLEVTAPRTVGQTKASVNCQRVSHFIPRVRVRNKLAGNQFYSTYLLYTLK